MNKTTKTILLCLLGFVCLAAVIAVTYRAMPHKQIKAEEVERIAVIYKDADISLTDGEINSIVSGFNHASEWVKTTDAAEPHFELIIHMKDGSRLTISDMCSYDSEYALLISRTILFKESQYVLLDKNIYSEIYSLIQDKTGDEDLCKENSNAIEN